MKLPFLLLGFALVCSMGITGYIHFRRKQEIHLNKQASFLDIKFRVSRDVLGEYQDQLIQSNSLLDKIKQEVDNLSKELSEAKTLVGKKIAEVDTCKGDKKRITDEIAASQTEKTNNQNEIVKEKSQWIEEISSLKRQMQEYSSLCDYIDKTSEEGRKLCGISEQPKPKSVEQKEAEEPKAEEPKAEEPKAEEPKAEEPKAEEPKAEEPKAEEPKAEEPKAEEPKAEEPKAEEPKAEEPK
ncbi:translation initiation factor IF-2-like [Myxocyprinus asiaticus]|uniref:translation initiation factor IF-2-like n=1 Tax=Myxocyprinus asiaticus TaxID=70543 RepID=UPI002222A758|nr:translation initiation factor IF-2-like [Myxocyprinus asiaticus]